MNRLFQGHQSIDALNILLSLFFWSLFSRKIIQCMKIYRFPGRILREWIIFTLCSELLSHFQYCVLSFLFFIWPFGYISFYPFFPSGQFMDLPSLWLFFCFLTLISACRSLFLIFLLWFCAYCLCPFLKVLSV